VFRARFRWPSLLGGSLGNDEIPTSVGSRKRGRNRRAPKYNSHLAKLKCRGKRVRLLHSLQPLLSINFNKSVIIFAISSDNVTRSKVRFTKSYQLLGSIKSGLLAVGICRLRSNY